jgi:hypothetical protein
MKTHTIEWQRLVQQGRTCERCHDTGATLRRVVRELNTRCSKAGVRFRLKTIRLTASRMADSNVILIDGEPLEQLAPGVRVTKTDCPSCGELIGQPAQCRAVVADGRTHEAVPAELIRAAVCRAADCCGERCDCDCGCAKPAGQQRSAPKRRARRASRRGIAA